MTRRSAAVALALSLALTGCSGDSDADERDRAPVSQQPPAPAKRLPGEVIDTVGVASFNVYRHLARKPAIKDAFRLIGDDDVDVIGWQETRADYFPEVKRRLSRHGWGTWQLWEPDGPFWLAVSWRRSDYTLVDGTWTEAHGGAGKSRTDLPYPPRGWIVVTLRHRASGKLLTVVDTHVNQGIEDGDGFSDRVNADDAQQHLRLLADVWDEVPGDLVVGMGDFNFDYADDSEARPDGGIWDTQHGRATSSYDVLGLDGVVPTRESRWIDYIWIADRTLRVKARDDGTGQYVEHRSLDGFESDHRPLVAQLRWYDR